MFPKIFLTHRPFPLNLKSPSFMQLGSVLRISFRSSSKIKMLLVMVAHGVPIIRGEEFSSLIQYKQAT